MSFICNYVIFADNHYWLIVLGLFITGQILLYNVWKMEVHNKEGDENNFVIDNYFPISIIICLWCIFWYVTLPFTLIGAAIILLVVCTCMIMRRNPPMNNPIVLQCGSTDWNRVADRAMYLWFDDVFTRQVVTTYRENSDDSWMRLGEFEYIFFIDHSQRHRVGDGVFVLEKVEIREQCNSV